MKSAQDLLDEIEQHDKWIKEWAEKYKNMEKEVEEDGNTKH